MVNGRIGKAFQLGVELMLLGQQCSMAVRFVDTHFCTHAHMCVRARAG